MHETHHASNGVWTKSSVQQAHLSLSKSSRGWQQLYHSQDSVCPVPNYLQIPSLGHRCFLSKILVCV